MSSLPINGDKEQSLSEDYVEERGDVLKVEISFSIIKIIQHFRNSQAGEARIKLTLLKI